jgi:hypothetical protein
MDRRLHMQPSMCNGTRDSFFGRPSVMALSGVAMAGCTGADDLPTVVSFYNERFAIGLTTAQMSDLVQFLSAL